MVESEPKKPFSIRDVSGTSGGDPLPFQIPQQTGMDAASTQFLTGSSANADFLGSITDEGEKQFASQVLQGFDAIFKHPSFVKGSAPRKRLDSYVIKIHEAMELAKQLEGELGERNHGFDVNVSASSVSDEDAIRIMGLRVGVGLYGLKMTEEQVELAAKVGAGDPAEQFAGPLREFSFRIVTLPHNGVALEEFANPEKMKKEGRVVDAYRLLTDTSHLSNPGIQKNETFQAGTFQQSYALLMAFAPDEIFNQKPTKNQAEKEAVKHAKLFARGVKSIREEIGTALFDSTHILHSEVAEIIKEDMMDPRRREIALLLLVDSIKHFYRKSAHLTQSQEDIELGHALMAGIESLIDGMPAGDQIRRVDELESVIEDQPNQEDSKDFEDIRKKAYKIFEKTSRLEYEFEGSEVFFDGIVAPSQIRVFFEKGKPFQMGVEMEYTNEHGEELVVDLYIDAKTGEFDWSLLEDPAQNPRKAQILFDYAYAVMDRVEMEAHHIQQSKKRTSDLAHPQIGKPKPRRKTIPPKRKPFEGSPQKTAEVIDFITKKSESEAKKSQIKRQIVFPEETVMEKMLKKLSHDDRAIVMARIQLLNERGAKIELLRDTGNARKSSNGNSLGKVVITGKNGGSKGIRVLVERGECIDGQEYWNVRAVDYREDIYNGHSLDKL